MTHLKDKQAYKTALLFMVYGYRYEHIANLFLHKANER